MDELNKLPLIDFTDCRESGVIYTGSEKKLGIVYKGSYYMLKFPKMVNGQATYNCISEYLASHIIELAGLDAHKTLLGTYKGDVVVAAKDFITGTDKILVEFAYSGDSSYDTDRNEHMAYTYEEILYLISRHAKMARPELIEERFWDMFVMDALLANFDRHGYNWGFVTNKTSYELAPIYDNGSSLFPRLQEKDIDKVLGDKAELDKRTYFFPMSQIQLNGKKSSYYEVIQSHKFLGCDTAINRILPRLDFNSIDMLIDAVPVISPKRKQFYKTIIQYRYAHIFRDVRSMRS